MKKIDSFENKFSLMKTLKFSLIPIGNTERNFNDMKLLEEDKIRAANYETMKRIMDRYHKAFIERVMSGFHFNDEKFPLKDYARIFWNKSKSEKNIKWLEDAEKEYRKQISTTLKKDAAYSKLFRKELIRELLPKYLTDETEKEVVSQFFDFTTYFRGFWDNRENMYSEEAKTGGIAYRSVNENLPRFLNNIKAFEKVNEVLSHEINKLSQNMNNVFTDVYFETEDLFTVDFFNCVLSQSGIDMYNYYLGGYTNSEGVKVQGLNEYINLYNQKIAKTDKSKRIPKLVPLYKQILSESDKISFLPEKFSNDQELIDSVREFVINSNDINNKITELFDKLNTFDFNGIYFVSGLAITNLSNELFGTWSAISDGWNEEYKAINPIKKKSLEKYEENMKEDYKRIKSFSLSDLEKYGGKRIIAGSYKTKIYELTTDIQQKCSNAEKVLIDNYSEDKKLITDEFAIELIKNLLDSYKALERTLKPFCGTGKEENRDLTFYGQFIPLFDELSLVDGLYDKVRNYLTQKPYSKDKIKLNFDNPQFLGGWDKNKESDYSCVLLKKSSDFYLVIMNRDSKNIFKENFENDGSCTYYEKIVCKQIPKAPRYISIKQIKPQKPPQQILEILEKKKKDSKSLDSKEICTFIDYCQNDFLKNYNMLIDENGENYFSFHFKKPSEYTTLNDFFSDVEKQAYSIKYEKISEDYIEQLVNEGKIFLFQIFNKDFSKYSKGVPNMHTLYFKELFSEENLKDGVFKLKGGAEMFYREPSLKKKEKPTHPANKPIANKNPNNPRKESIFKYDLIKDKRFTERQFSIHIPITLNFKSQNNEYINPIVRSALRECERNYVIGIDRGERNLLYVCVIDENERIVYQKSLNEIIYRDYKVDYHQLLDEKEKERLNARKNWKSIENIKELKEGYLSAVVNEICKLVVKYDAIIVMEDLNKGFKKGRFKVEKQVYQKFENMLINKLNYLVDKKLPNNQKGGLLHAYQLTNKNKAGKSDNNPQNGFVFYIPAYLTSKIDPVTGFCDLLHPRYKNIDESRKFFSAFDDIYYSEDDDMFVFETDFDKFEKCSMSYKKHWKIYTNGERIRTFRNSEKNSEWDNQTVVLTEEYKNLFEKYNMDYSKNLHQQILNRTEGNFFERITKLLALTLQMRNSITNNIEVDYLISPVKNDSGDFYDSRNYTGENAAFPINADANGAFNIARKGAWAVKQIKNADESEYEKTRISIKNDEWLKFAQSNHE